MNEKHQLPFSCAVQSPDSQFLVFVAGQFLQPLDLSTLQFVSTERQKNEMHQDLVRCVAFNHSGSILISGGDDKMIKAWETKSWTCCRQVQVPKKLTALRVTNDDTAIYADKFGNVYKFELAPFLSGSSNLRAEEHTLVLGHCSTVTDMILSDDERYIITADRDERVRVSHWPNAYNIQTFCLGHTAFVSKVLAVQRVEIGLNGEGVVLFTASGDGTVRAWSCETGTCLATAQLSSPNTIVSSLAWLSSQNIIAAAAVDECAVYMWRVKSDGASNVSFTLLHVWSTHSEPYALLAPSNGVLWKLGPPPLIEAFSYLTFQPLQDLPLANFVNSFGSFSVDRLTYSAVQKALHPIQYRKAHIVEKNKNENGEFPSSKKKRRTN
jgi:WD40 repeat protein